MSIQTGIPLEASKYAYAQGLDDYETLWSKIAMTAKQHGLPLPERSSMVAWKQCEQGFKDVALTGSLKMLEQPGGGIFEFKLNPLKIERTYRLARKLGHDRFFVLSVPSIEPQHLPPHVRSDPNAQQSIVDWLVHSEHSFLGRKWRAFYVKPESTRKAGPYSSITLNEGKFRVYLFAENGCDFAASTIGGEKDPRKMNHMPMGRKELIEWLMSFKNNRDEPALKFFSRIGLGLSTSFFFNWVILNRIQESVRPNPLCSLIRNTSYLAIMPMPILQRYDVCIMSDLAKKRPMRRLMGQNRQS